MSRCVYTKKLWKKKKKVDADISVENMGTGHKILNFLHQ